MLWMSMTKAQHYATKELRRAQQSHLEHSPSPGLFFQDWTPEMTPCCNPLCCMPHHQSQTTSPSPCSDNIASHEYALHWLADHPGYAMQGEGLESVQVPSVCPVSLDSPVSSTRHRHLDSGGGWTSKPPISPESIPISPDLQSQEQSMRNSQVQEAEASREHSQYYALPPLSICTPPPVPTWYIPAAETSALDDAAIPGGYPW